MTDKTLRILIADPQHAHRMEIERLFNGLDYYRVAPVQDLIELLTLVDYGSEPFDVLVINAELAAGALDLRGFLLDNPQVRHALIYNEPSAPLHAAAGFAQENVQVSHTRLPNSQAIRQLMALVDAPHMPHTAADWQHAQPLLRRAHA